jgi:hypothetical protein
MGIYPLPFDVGSRPLVRDAWSLAAGAGPLFGEVSEGQPMRGRDAVELDLTKPDTGRIVDYWLGGHHNFEVDRAAAARIEVMAPVVSNWIKGQRAFLGQCVQAISARGISQFLVAGAGLPTCGNVHEVAPAATVLYTDISPVTIAYGRHIIGDNPLVRYEHGNATALHNLDGVVANMFSPMRPVGIVYIGIAHFLPDQALDAAFRELYRWVPAGSWMTATFAAADAEAQFPEAAKFYEQMGAKFYSRSVERIISLLGPWQVDSSGVVAVPIEGLVQESGAPQAVLVHGCICKKTAAA